MVMSSAQIAQMNGSFQGAAMNQMMYSGMIGQGSPYSGERMAGSFVNTASSIASPLAMGGAALAGLDPFSMALKGGSAGFAAGGIGGAAVGALGGAAVVGVPMMAAGYAGGQFLQGAQQHQQLGSQLRSSFGFRNQFGGSGFTGGDVGQIGSAMRDMTSQLGPGGEQVNFDELGRLASNMGRMGMAQGVRSAKEFTDKFKQMVSSLKEIAQEFGTSLEEAQKMMAGMKQSGVFGVGQQAGFAKMIRSGAQAGGMATTELTGMMSIGSQISRMVGGRGSAGAQGGIETITNIGVAQKMGILSEEAIYNATGQTGAMGRRALATQQMQGAARFLKGGLGRRMLAAMADQDGELDDDDADEFMSGGVSVNRTRQMWKENLRGVGRANFIRNEGRLRGEALRKFGGLAPAIAMRGWMAGKGIDVNTDNDRAMLFLQRRLRMGRDEADAMVKQIRDLPQIMREREIAGKEEGMAKRMSTRDKMTGIDGLKRKLDQAAAEVRGELQEAGAGFMENLSNEFEGLVNELTGTRVKEFRRDVVRAFESAKLGGATGAAAMSQTFGIGQGGGIASNLRGLKSPAQTSGGMGGDPVGGAAGAAIGSIGRGLMGLIRPDTGFMAEFDRSDRERFAERGYQFGDLDQSGVASRLSDIRRFASAAAGRGTDVKLGDDAKSKLRDMYSKVSGLGDKRAKSVEAMLLGSDDPEAKAIGRKLRQAGTPEEKGKIIAGLNRALGRPDEGKLYAAPDMMGVYNTSDHLTFKDQAQAIGESLLGTTGERRTLLATGEQNKAIYDAMDGMLRKVGILDRKESLFAKDISEEAVAATGAFARTEEGRSIAAEAISNDAGTRRASIVKVQSDIAKLEAKQASGDMGVTERGQLEYLRSVRAAQKLQDIGGVNASEADKRKAAEELNMTPKQFMSRAAGVVGMVGNAQREARAQLEGEESEKRLASMKRGGLVTTGKGGKAELSADVAEAFGAGTAAGDFLRAMVEQEDLMSRLNSITDDEEREKLLTSAFGEGGAQESRMASLGKMSVKDMRSLADNLRGAGASETRKMLLGKASRMEQLSKGGKKRRLKNLTNMFGVDMSRKDIMAAMESGGAENLTDTLMKEMGLESSASREDITAAITAAQRGDTNLADKHLTTVMGGQEATEARKKKSLAQAQQQDPLQAEANKFLQNIETKLEEQSKYLSSIATNTNKEAADAEAT